MVGAFGLYAHLKQGQANLSAGVLAPILGGDVHITRAVKRLVGGHTLLIGIKEIEFKLRTELNAHALCGGRVDGSLEYHPRILLKLSAVGVFHRAKHSYYIAVRRPPRENIEGRGHGEEQQIRANLVAEALDSGGVKRNAVGKGSGQFVGRYGYIFLLAVHVAESEADEFDILLPDKIVYFSRRVYHTLTS